MLGGIFSGWVSRVERQGRAVIWAIIVWGLAITVFGVAAGLANGSAGVMLGVAVGMLVIGGAADMVSSAFRNSMLMTAATDEVRGRLQGIFIVVVAGGPRVADVLHGSAAALVGTSVAAAGGGVLVVIGTVVAAIAVPAFVRYRLPRPKWATRVHVPSPTRATTPRTASRTRRCKLYLDQSGTGFRQVRNWGITGFGGVRFAEVVDFNRDSWDDLLVSFSGGPLLYRNNAGTGFTNVSSANGLTGNPSDAVFGDLDRDGDQDLVTSAGSRVDYRLYNGTRFLAPVRAYAVPQGGQGRAVSVGDADDDGDLDIYALVSNINAGTNPRDVVLRNTSLQFAATQVPAATGIGDAVTALDGNGDGRTEFLVLNGVEVSGPIQRIELRFQ